MDNMVTNKQKLSYVIPCYNSENTIEQVVEEIEKIMKGKNEYNYEIILVNDCSPDGVWNVIKRLAQGNKNIKALSFSKNFGQHAALLGGYRIAEGDIIISLDDDGQSPVDSTFNLISKLDEGFDVVYARYYELKEALWRRFGSWLSNTMSERLIGKPKHILGSSFYVMRKFIKDEMIKYYGPYTFIGGLVFRTTKNIANVYVEHHDRIEGRSGYTLIKLISLWVNGFTAFSVVPLRISSIMGVTSAVFGFMLGIITLIRKLLHPEIVAGWSSVIACVLFVGGLIMVMLGMLGEYMGRIYININRSPQYVVKETMNLDRNQEKSSE